MLSMAIWKKSFKMFKIKSFWKKIRYFLLVFCFFLPCPLLGGNFHRGNSNRTWTFCPLERGVHYFCPLFRSFSWGMCTNVASLLTFVRYLEMSAVRDVHWLFFLSRNAIGGPIDILYFLWHSILRFCISVLPAGNFNLHANSRI